jgi:hypothetical protein
LNAEAVSQYRRGSVSTNAPRSSAPGITFIASTIAKRDATNGIVPPACGNRYLMSGVRATVLL